MIMTYLAYVSIREDILCLLTINCYFDECLWEYVHAYRFMSVYVCMCVRSLSLFTFMRHASVYMKPMNVPSLVSYPASRILLCPPCQCWN